MGNNRGSIMIGLLVMLLIFDMLILWTMTRPVCGEDEIFWQNTETLNV